jgi:hypothetical protein
MRRAASAILESSSVDTTVGGRFRCYIFEVGNGKLDNLHNNGWKTVCDIVSDYRREMSDFLYEIKTGTRPIPGHDLSKGDDDIHYPKRRRPTRLEQRANSLKQALSSMSASSVESL